MSGSPTGAHGHPFFAAVCRRRPAGSHLRCAAMAVLLLSGGLAAAQDAAVDAAPDQVETEEKRREETISLWRKLFGGRAGKGKGKAEPAFKIDVSVGYATYQAEMKPGRWYPVWVRIEAKKGDAEGVVALTQVENPLEVEVPFSVAEGSTKIYPSYFRPRLNDFNISNAQIDAEVRAKGRRRPETIPLPHPVAPPGARHLLILSEERGGFRSLVRRTPDEDERAGSSSPARRAGVSRGSVGGLRAPGQFKTSLPRQASSLLERQFSISPSTPRVQACSDAFLTLSRLGDARGLSIADTRVRTE